MCVFHVVSFPLHSPPPLPPPPHSISMKARYVLEGGRGFGGCSRAWLSALFNSVLAGWRGPRLANGCSGVFGYRTQLSFPPWRVPLSPRPREVSLLLPSPRHTPPPPLPPPNSLLSYPPSATLSNIQPRGREGASKILSRKHTNSPSVHGSVHVCAYTQFAKTVFPV